MTTIEAIKKFHEKWGLFVSDLREHGISPYEIILALFLLSISIFFLSISYTVLFDGGLEYSVKIGK